MVPSSDFLPLPQPPQTSTITAIRQPPIERRLLPSATQHESQLSASATSSFHVFADAVVEWVIPMVPPPLGDT
jgi:hypothetical protein